MRAMLLVASLCTVFGACTALPPSKTEALGPPFNEDAKQGYVALASSEWNEGDWDFLHFDDKATDAMLGDEVWPDRVASRRMPAPAREEMLVQRARLVDALEGERAHAEPARCRQGAGRLRLLARRGRGQRPARARDRLQGHLHGATRADRGQAV